MVGLVGARALVGPGLATPLHLDTSDQGEGVLDISQNTAHLFLLKHSKISSHIFDVLYFFNDAKECC